MSEETPPTSSASLPEDWQSAIADFAATRIALIQIEARDAAQTAARKTAHAVTLAIVSLSAWLCLLAAAIGAFHHFAKRPWWEGALLLAILHLIIALRLAALLKRPAPPAFPITRAEFEKDRLWMQNLKKSRN
jgi:uncharacterized membrane protein YgcG